MSAASPTRQIARAAGTVMIALVISQIAGLVRRVLVAQAFGTAVELDAFLASNRVAEILFNLIAGGALGSAFIPTFTALLAREQRLAAWRLASAIANLVLLVLCALAGLAAVFAPQVVRYVLAPGLAADASVFALTVQLLRMQIVSAILFGLGGLIVGILNSCQVFFIPALTPAMYQLGLIFGVLVLSPRMGIHGLAWGVVIGSGLYLLVQFPTLFRQGGQFTLTLGVSDPAVREVLRLMAPRLFGVAVIQINFLVNAWLASQMPAGSLSAVDYGFSLMLMAQIALAQSIGTAAMPTLARQFSLGHMEALGASLTATLRGVLLLSIPASLGLILLRQPIIAMLYQRGEFNAHSTELVAWALLWYAAGLVGHSLVEVLARTFYALHDTKTPVLVGAAAMSLNILLSFGLSDLFSRLGWMPHGGLALANSFATTVEAAILLGLIRRRLAGLAGRSVLAGGLKSGLAGAVMALALFGWLALTTHSNPWIVAGGGVVVGAGVYGLSALGLGMHEIRSVLSIISRR